ncbi:MAG: hypothetical protein IT303_03345 [Dehalococcoidia bacterium]|nr:hypothetical protein [Dehalococcoidia bacterium]
MGPAPMVFAGLVIAFIGLAMVGLAAVLFRDVRRGDGGTSVVRTFAGFLVLVGLFLLFVGVAATQFNPS